MRLPVLVALAVVTPAFGNILYPIPAPANAFGLLAGTVSNTGTSLVAGNVGANITVTGFAPTGLASGFICTPTSGAPCTVGDDSEVTSAYNSLFGVGGDLSAGEALPSTGVFSTASNQSFVGNKVYASPGSISTASGTNLTFDAQGDPTEVFVIQVGGNFTVNGTETFTLLNGAQANNIFWIVSNAATISVGSAGPITFDGNIIAGSTFTMSAATGGSAVLAGTINGCIFSQTTATLAGTTNVSGCSASTTPEPATAGMASVAGLVALAARIKHRKARIADSQ